jgi:hypothetical protein
MARQRVLVADGGMPRSRTALATVRALGQAGFDPLVTTTGASSLAATSKYCRGRLVAPPVDEPGYADAVRALAARHEVVEVVATSDEALVALRRGAWELVDKRVLATSASSAGIVVPSTTELPSYAALLASVDALELPLIVKPTSPPAKPFEVRDHADLPATAPWAGPVLVQPLLEGEVRSICGVVWDGALVAAVHQRTLRTWPVRCGVSCAAETVEPDLPLERAIATLVAEHRGVFQAQLIGEHLIDLNLRPYGSMPLAVAAGANLVAIECSLAAGATSAFVRGRPGVFFRWLDADVRHVVDQVRRGSMTVIDAGGALRPRRGAAHSTESLTDPRPMLRRLQLGQR